MKISGVNKTNARRNVNKKIQLGTRSGAASGGNFLYLHQDQLLFYRFLSTTNTPDRHL